MQKKEKLSILDVGTGYSYFPFYISSFGHDVTCCDLIDLSSLYRNTCVDFIQDDITNSFNNNTYDLIYCISVLEHINDKESAIDKMHSMLKSGGKLILTLDCDLLDEKISDTPNYCELARLLCLLNSKFDKKICDFNLSRTGLLISADFNAEKWRLPWRYKPQKGQTLFQRVQSFFSVSYCLNTMPCLGVFVATWIKR